MTTPTEAEFWLALGVRRTARLAVSAPGAAPTEVEMSSPCAVIGRSPEAQIRLEDETVAYRHAYLQAIGGRLVCLDLFSPNGVRWDDGSDQVWLHPGRIARLGAVRMQLTDDSWPTADLSLPSPLDYKPREGGRMEYGVLPEVELQTLNQTLGGISWPINRVITLVGRDDRCRITCGDSSVSKVHCSLLLLPSGLWVVDLLGKGGTLVDDAPQPFARLREGSVLQVGRYRMQVRYLSPAATLPPERAEQVAFFTKLHRIFPVTWDGETLIVTPQGRSRDFRYQDIQIEANAVISALRTFGFRNVLVDFSCVKLTGSLIVDAVTQFCRAASGLAAICGCSPEQYSALKDMNLISIWPCYATREEGIRAIRVAQSAAPQPAQG